eukprot:SAG22_NODE_2046_length_3086_cov_3.806495_2_plen_289_part_00
MAPAVRCAEGRLPGVVPPRFNRGVRSVPMNVSLRPWPCVLQRNWRSCRPALCVVTSAVTRRNFAAAAAAAAQPANPKHDGLRAAMTMLSDEVANTESTARDHLANERTFLAWARSGMAFVGLGVGLDTLSDHKGTQPGAASPPPPVHHQQPRTDTLPEQAQNSEPASSEYAEAEQVLRLHFGPPGPAAAKAPALPPNTSGSSLHADISRYDPGSHQTQQQFLFSKMPSALCVLVGGLFLTYATARYFEVRNALMRGTFPVNTFGIVTIVVSSGIIVAGGLFLVFFDVF